MYFLEGFGVGLAMMLFIGPVFFTLIQTSLQHGYKAGLAVAMGIAIGDAICIGLCAFGAIPFFKNAENQFWIALAGGILLIALGIKYVFNREIKFEPKFKLKAKHYTSFFSKGFIINFVNPFVFLVWIGVVGYGQGKYGTSSELAMFLSAAVLGIFLTDTTKVFLAHKIKPFIRPKVLVWIYRVIGVLLIAFGIRMLVFVL